MTPPTSWVVSVDLGQAHDYTAVSILEVTSRLELVRRDPAIVCPHDLDVARAKYPAGLAGAGRIDVRYLERLPLRMLYPAQIEIIAALLRRPPLHRGVKLVVDATGVGRPVVDLFRRAGLRPIAVTITAGDSEAREGDDYRVAKSLLVSRTLSLLHAGELNISPRLALAQTLANEFQDFRAVYNDTGYVRFSHREGAHDDLVLSVALGVWWASKTQPTVAFGTWEANFL